MGNFWSDNFWKLGGVYMIPVRVSFRHEIYNFVRRLHGSHLTGMTRSFLWALVLTSHVGALLTIDTHSLPVPVNLATHLVPERNLVPPLHDTGTECGQISYRYERFVPVSCKRIQSYKWEPGWTRTGMKLVLVSCKHPLTVRWSKLNIFFSNFN